MLASQLHPLAWNYPHSPFQIYLSPLCKTNFVPPRRGQYQKFERPRWDAFESAQFSHEERDLGVGQGSQVLDRHLFRVPSQQIREMPAPLGRIVTNSVLPGTLGPVHLGFSLGMAAAWKLIKPGVIVRQKPLILAGHSLGAARAWILAGMAIVDGVVPARVVVFGSPRPGFAQLASVVAEAPQKSYRNRLDPVCEVPFTIPPEFPYVEPAPFTKLDVPPTGADQWGPLADHHMPLYVAGLSASQDRLTLGSTARGLGAI